LIVTHWDTFWLISFYYRGTGAHLIARAMEF
jgi:hypothetical protein